MTILISMLIVRAGAIALTMTGVSYSRAKFQSLSAFTGTGFTTREAEMVVNHPTRRQIISWMMILGNAGIVTLIITTTASFVVTDVDVLPLNMVVLLAGVGGLYLLMTRTGLARRWEALVERHLGATALFEEGPADELLHLIEGYGLIKLTVGDDSVLAGQAIADAGIPEKGFRVLGIERGNDWIAAPRSREIMHPEDRLVIYGRLDRLRTFARTG
jgi:hypothetical protein